jgi:Spy/CpxP family protein refolding chaperone
MRPLNHRPLLLAVGLALAGAAHAAPPMGMPDGNPPPPPMIMHGGPDHAPLPPFLHGIKLTDAQLDKLFEIMHAQAPNLRAREKELRQSHEALIKLSLNDEFDDGKAKALADAGARAMSEIALMRARIDYQAYRQLTPEQRKQLAGGKPHLVQQCVEPSRR